MQAVKIMQVITTGETGGAQSHLYELCTHLPKRFEPIIVTGFKGTMGDKLEQAGIPVHVLPSLRREISLDNDLEALRELNRLIGTLQPALVCLHSSKAGFLGRLAAERHGVPAVFTAHGWAFAEGVPSFSRWIYHYLERWAARRTARIICVSQHDHQLALRLRVAPADKMVVVHNGIPAGLGQPIPREANRVVRIIMVARFAPQKNQMLLVQALNQLEPSRPVELLLVGDGPLLESNRSYAAGLPVGSQVHFLGDRDDVEHLLQEADIFVLSSWWEGLPITILEAMRAGLPVIASDVGGCREAVIDGSNGFLFQAGDIKGLVQRLDQLVQDQDLRTQMGRCGYEIFMNHFCVNKMVDATVRIYDEVLAWAIK